MISLHSLKKALLIAACTGLLLQTSSCITTEKEAGNSRNANRTFTPTPEGARSRVNARTLLRTVNTTHYFSNTKAKDNFILQLRGPKILNAKAHFIILSSTGDTLRSEIMPATALLGEREMAARPATTVREKEIAILQAMNAFLREEHFTKPLWAATG